MSDDGTLAKGHREVVPKRGKGLSVINLMSLRPSDVIRFSVYDHEETKLFGVMRDEMMERRAGESTGTWEKRCREVEEWNRWRSKLMTAVFVNAVVRSRNLDADAQAAFRFSYVMAVGAGFLKEARKRYGKDSEVLRCLTEAYGGAGEEEAALDAGGPAGLIGGGGDGATDSTAG